MWLGVTNMEPFSKSELGKCENVQSLRRIGPRLECGILQK
jgi:hypothetical protein